MRIVQLEGAASHHITEFDSRGACIGGVTRGEEPFQLSYLQLESGGVLGAHAATCRQLLLLLSGEGMVSGGDGVTHLIRQGQAVCWEEGEMHETSTNTGLTALVLEAVNFALLLARNDYTEA